MSWDNADCHQLLTDGLLKSDQRDQELQDANIEIERLQLLVYEQAKEIERLHNIAD